jgi:hypothetical protein
MDLTLALCREFKSTKDQKFLGHLFEALIKYSSRSAEDFTAQPVEDAGVISSKSPNFQIDRCGRPFIIGSPIVRDEDFVGRKEQIDLIHDTVGNLQPAQVLGERRMGKTSFLLWLQRNVAAWQDYPVAFVSAQGRAGRSPSEFVREIAIGIGRVEDVGDQLKRTDTEAAGQALERLLPVMILVDEAANLAKPEHGFNNDFLDTLRAFGQSGDLIWISASHLDLRKLFLSSGRTSSFLNDARQVSIGQLEDEAARSIVSRLKDQDDGNIAIDLAGGFAFGLQWIADALWRDPLNRTTIDSSYSLAMDSVFHAWWDHCDRTEQQILHLSIARPTIDELDLKTRIRARRLQQLGILIEHAGGLHLPGRAWCSFVEGMPDMTTEGNNEEVD